MNKMENIRLLTYVSRFIGYSAPGLESEIYEEYLHLAKHHKVIIITEEGNQENLSNIRVKVVSKSSIPKIRGFLKIIRYVNSTYKNRDEYDVVYIRTFSLPELIAGVFAKKFLKKPLFFLIPGTWIFVGEGNKIRFLRYIFKKTCKHANRIIVYSNLILPEIRQLIGKIDDSKVVSIKNPVDSKQFSPLDNNFEDLLFVGRIHPLKSIEDIIKSLPKVKEKFPNVKLNLVGKIESQKYYQSLKNLIKKLECEENVIFIGPIPHKKIEQYYQNSKIFVFMGKNEGIPRSMLEAMSCGKVVIAAPNSGIPDVIIDSKNGILVKNGEHDLLSNKIINLLSDIELAKKLGTEARSTIEKEHTWSNFITNLNEQFKNF